MNFSDAREDGPIQRLPTAAKLAALFGLSIAVFAIEAPAVLAAIAGAVLLVSLLLCRAGLVQWLRAWPLLLTIAVVVAWTAHATGPWAALTVLLRLGSLSLFATIVTTTTTIGQFIDTITAFARPLERIGIANARDIGLSIGLVIRFIPEVHARYKDVADAHRARGLRMGFSTLLVPMMIGTLQSADEIANAIDARGIRSATTSKQE